MISSAVVAGNDIADVKLIPLTLHRDLRGSFTEVFQQSWETVLQPQQFSIVSSSSGVMRGCHIHLNHDEYFCLVSGEVSVGLRDERPNSPTRNAWSLIRLYEEDPVALVFPRGLVHGWYYHKDSIHLQSVSEPYSEYACYDNHRVNWLDSDLEIPWPSSTAITSPEANAAQSLEEFRKWIGSVHTEVSE